MAQAAVRRRRAQRGQSGRLPGCSTSARSRWAGRYRYERHRALGCSGVDIGPDAARGRWHRRGRRSAGVDRERAADHLRVRPQRRRPSPVATARWSGACTGAGPCARRCSSWGSSSASPSSCWCSRRRWARRGAGVQRRPAGDPGPVRHSDVGTSSTRSAARSTPCASTRPTSPVATVSGGVADVGVSAFGAVTLFFSVISPTLFGLIDEPRVRDWISLMYRDARERYLDVTDRIVNTTSRYMLGNLAISVICGTVYGVTAVILDLPYPLALALIAGSSTSSPPSGPPSPASSSGSSRCRSAPRRWLSSRS